jgi:hypothetical protein
MTLALDLSSGLDPVKESVLLEKPDIEHWAENFLFALHDPQHDIAMWLHLGTMPNRWHLWEERAIIALPGDAGILTTRAYTQTPPESRPGAGGLFFECLEPFRRWRIRLEGFGRVTPSETLRTGLEQDGLRDHFSVDLEVTCRTPVWDMHEHVARRRGDEGAMREQSWASEHYEQLYTVTGTVQLPTGEVAFDGTGWRDHSRGPRGANTGRPWGGHVILGAYLPESDRGIGLCRYYAPGGGVTLEGGYVSQGPTMHHAEVLGASRLEELVQRGEPLRFGLRSDLGELWIDATTTTSMFTMLRRSRQYYGIDPTGALGSRYALNWARFELDGEVGHLYVERTESPAAE